MIVLITLIFLSVYNKSGLCPTISLHILDNSFFHKHGYLFCQLNLCSICSQYFGYWLCKSLFMALLIAIVLASQPAKGYAYHNQTEKEIKKTARVKIQANQEGGNVGCLKSLTRTYVLVVFEGWLRNHVFLSSLFFRLKYFLFIGFSFSAPCATNLTTSL